MDQSQVDEGVVNPVADKTLGGYLTWICIDASWIQRKGVLAVVVRNFIGIIIEAIKGHLDGCRIPGGGGAGGNQTSMHER